jgi:hypothetical protein
VEHFAREFVKLGKGAGRCGRATSSTNTVLGLKSTEERSYGDWGTDPWGRRRNH